MENIKISPEMLLMATDYMPIQEKEKFIKESSTKCFEKFEIRLNNDSNITLPPLYKENYSYKSKCLLGVLAKFYLKQEIECADNEDWLMTDYEFNRWQSGHALNQIERFKMDNQLRNKCFDLLQDYKDLEKRLNLEIFSLLNAMNDPINRFLSALKSQIDPDMLQKSQKELESLNKELANAKTKFRNKWDIKNEK